MGEGQERVLVCLGICTLGASPQGRPSLTSTVPLSRKSQRFSSINTSVGGELWGPEKPQGSLIPSKINLGAGTSRERPEKDAGGPQTGPSSSSRAACKLSPHVRRKHTPLTDGRTEAQAVSGQGEALPYLPSCRDPGSRVSTLQDKGTGSRVRGVSRTSSLCPRPAPQGGGQALAWSSEGGGAAGGRGGPGGWEILAKSPFLRLPPLPHLSHAGRAAAPPAHPRARLTARGVNRGSCNC